MEAFKKMETLSIKPNDETFNQLMTAYAKNRDIEMVEKINEEAISKYGIVPSAMRYNALILAYCKSNRALDAEKVLLEMKKNGLKPDVVTYTTVIDAYKRVNDINKCWELYEHYSTIECGDSPPDEFMITFMIRLCSATHDAEKAIKLFNELESNGFIEHAIPYNAIIFSLASTKRYAEKALEYWGSM